MNGRRHYEQLMLEPDRDREMASLKKLVLESMRSTLVENVDPTTFLPFLRSKFVVSDRENAEIKSSCCRSVYEGADKLVDVLCTKGARGYDLLCEAIHQDQTQLYLLTQMNMRLEKLRFARQQEVDSLEAARALEHQRQVQLFQHHQQQEQSAYQPPQHQGAPGMMSPSTVTSTYAQLPPHFVRPLPMQHYNRGGEAFEDHSSDYHDPVLMGRGGSKEMAPHPIPNEICHRQLPAQGSTHPTNATSVLPPPAPQEDDPDSVPGGQHQ